MENIIDREVAWRIFALEFNRSNLYLSEGDERAPNYIITPTGVKCNRLFIVGVVTEIENIGADNSLWRARIADPTGVFTVYAGQYQPEAAIFLSELNVPAYVAVVGKARRYEPEEGSVYTSIRPEEINHADEKLRDRWVLDTAELTLERIRIIEDALKLGMAGNDLRDHLLKRGINTTLADGAVRAIQHYKNLITIIAELKNALIHAVELVSSDASEQPVEEHKEPQIDADEYRSQEPLIKELKKSQISIDETKSQEQSIEKQKEQQIDDPRFQELFEERKEPQMNADERRLQEQSIEKHTELWINIDKPKFQEQFIEKKKELQIDVNEYRSQEQSIDKQKELQISTDKRKLQEQSIELPEQSISEIERAITESKEVATESKEIVTEPESTPEPSITEAPVQIEPKDILADIIDRLDTGKGTSYSSVVEAAISAGIDSDSIEASIKELMEEGRCYEPRIGVLRKV